MTSGPEGASFQAEGSDNAPEAVPAEPILGSRRRRRQVRELVDELDADELQELAAYLDERLRDITGSEGAADPPLPRREAA